jgi:hypothetical protein
MLLGLFGPVGASRQAPDCDPSGSGCPIRFDEGASAALVDPSDAHIWWLTVPIAGSFRVYLTNLPGDYRLYVYAPDGNVAGQSSNPGSADEILDVPVAVPGDYAVFVDSPLGDVSGAPYLLTAFWTGAAALPAAPATSVPIPDLRPPPATRAPAPTAIVVGEPTVVPLDDTLAPAAPTAILAAPTQEATPSTGPVVRFPTSVAAQPTPTRGPTVPATCTGQPKLTLESTAIRSGDVVVWEAHGFRPGSSVRAQAFAAGTQPVSDVGVSAVDSDCTTGPGGEVVVTVVPRAPYYILRVTGQRYGTGTEHSLIARFSVSTAR